MGGIRKWAIVVAVSAALVGCGKSRPPDAVRSTPPAALSSPTPDSEPQVFPSPADRPSFSEAAPAPFPQPIVPGDWLFGTDPAIPSLPPDKPSADAQRASPTFEG